MIAGPREIVECGKSILSHLLRTNSALYGIFHLPQNGCPENELQALPAFIRQAANFAMVFDFVMTNIIDDIEKVCFALDVSELANVGIPSLITKFRYFQILV